MRAHFRPELSTYKVLARNDRLINRSLRVFTVWIYRGFSEYLPKNDPNDRIYLQYLLESSQQDLPRIYFRIYIYRQGLLRIYRGFTGFTVWIYRGFTEDLPGIYRFGRFTVRIYPNYHIMAIIMHLQVAALIMVAIITQFETVASPHRVQSSNDGAAPPKYSRNAFSINPC